MIIGSMSGALAAAGGFCAGSDDVVEHQRISAASYTFSAALPAMAAVTASEALMMLQTQPELMMQLRETIKTMWGQLDPRSDWVYCTSAPENPIMLMVLKPEVLSSKRLGWDDQQQILQDVVDECLAQGVLITRVKSLSPDASGAKTTVYTQQPALKICLTI
ncbi:serine palmitoyl transferase subunit, partial [Lasallia pustulata]